MSNQRPSLMHRVLRKLNQHRTTETYFIGYPKTGTTWLQFLLGNYLKLECGLTEMPLFDQTDGFGRCVRHAKGPAMTFTHRPLSWGSQTSSDLTRQLAIAPFCQKDVVFIVRNPLDVLVSHWFQERYQVKGGFQGELSEYIAHPVFGLDKLLHFYALWHEHQTAVRRFHVVRYEDLRARPQETMTPLLDFLDIGLNAQSLAEAIDMSSFERMREIERSGNVPTIASSGLKVFATGDLSNPDSYHVRRGKVGGYRDYLSGDELDALERRIEERVGDWLGYRVDASAAKVQETT